MGLPTKKHSRQATGSRRSHHALKGIQIAWDSAGNPHLPHHATPASGKYRGRQVTNITKRAVRRAKNKV